MLLLIAESDDDKGAPRGQRGSPVSIVQRPTDGQS
jgi:hypothetical protein